MLSRRFEAGRLLHFRVCLPDTAARIPGKGLAGCAWAVIGPCAAIEPSMPRCAESRVDTTESGRIHGRVAEWADALDSGSSARKGIGVRGSARLPEFRWVNSSIGRALVSKTRGCLGFESHFARQLSVVKPGS